MRFILLTVALLVRARQFPVSFCVLQSLIKFRFSPTWDHLLPQILRNHLNIKEFLVQSALRIQLVIYTEDNPSTFSSSTYWGYPPYVFNFYILRISTPCFQFLYTEDIHPMFSISIYWEYSLQIQHCTHPRPPQATRTGNLCWNIFERSKRSWQACP